VHIVGDEQEILTCSRCMGTS